jgi:hypothetical protein
MFSPRGLFMNEEKRIYKKMVTDLSPFLHRLMPGFKGGGASAPMTHGGTRSLAQT